MNRSNQDKFVIIVAGGKGLRMGGDMPKQFMLLADRPVLLHTIEAFHRYDSALNIVLVLPEGQKVYWQNLCTDFGFAVPHKIATGGETRFHSVRNALALIEKLLAAKTCPSDNALIGVHDGVRPLVDRHTIAACYEQAELARAAYPVLPITDSLRKISQNGKRAQTVDRTKYVRVQTPQVFRADILFAAYRQPYDPLFTDDVSVVEAAGTCTPVMIEGNPRNIKITTPIDFEMAKMLINIGIK